MAAGDRLWPQSANRLIWAQATDRRFRRQIGLREVARLAALRLVTHRSVTVPASLTLQSLLLLLLLLQSCQQSPPPPPQLVHYPIHPFLSVTVVGGARTPSALWRWGLAASFVTIPDTVAIAHQTNEHRASGRAGGRICRRQLGHMKAARPKMPPTTTPIVAAMSNTTTNNCFVDSANSRSETKWPTVLRQPITGKQNLAVGC